MRMAVILPAAGAGKRFNQASIDVGPDADKFEDTLLGGKRTKVELDLAGKPVFLRAIEIFLQRDEVEQILVAVNPDAVDEFKFRWGDKLAMLRDVQVVPGGKTERWETVLKAIEAVKPGITHVAIHDAARPLTSQKLVRRVFEAAGDHPAVIPGMPVAATLKRVKPVEGATKVDPLDALLGGPTKDVVKRVVETVDRSELVEVQTPQVFEIGLLKKAYAQITSGKLSGKGITDDAGLVESLGQTVYVVEGEATNLKITRPDDLKMAEAYLRVNEVKDAAEKAKKKLFKDDED